MKVKGLCDKFNIQNIPKTITEIEFTETCAMAVLGLHNPSNLKAVVRWNCDTIQYREWIKLFPYKAQFLAKLIFDEDVSIGTFIESRN